MITKNYIKDFNQRWRELNPEPAPTRYERYKDTIKATVSQWQADHREERREYHRKRYKTIPKVRQQTIDRSQLRRARKAGVEGSHTSKEWRDKKAQYNFRCAYCGKKARVLTKDHIIPISEGGSNYIANIVPACSFCNSSKQARELLDWKRFNGLQLSIEA